MLIEQHAVRSGHHGSAALADRRIRPSDRLLEPVAHGGLGTLFLQRCPQITQLDVQLSFRVLGVV